MFKIGHLLFRVHLVVRNQVGQRFYRGSSTQRGEVAVDPVLELVKQHEKFAVSGRECETLSVEIDNGGARGGERVHRCFEGIENWLRRGHERIEPIQSGTSEAESRTAKTVWIQEGLYDKKYVETHTVGFDVWRDDLLGKEDGIVKSPEWQEKETGVPAERPHVAAVFVNRLRLGIRLQSDPTIIYTLTGGYPLGRGIRESELNRVTPYNTYAVAGLPPGPICNPGKDAIAAVLNPGTTEDMYFVAAGNGGHVFSKTVEEQNRPVAELRARERAARAGHP